MKRFLSLGAGVQSSTLALGEQCRYPGAIFSGTTGEGKFYCREHIRVFGITKSAEMASEGLRIVRESMTEGGQHSHRNPPRVERPGKFVGEPGQLSVSFQQILATIASRAIQLREPGEDG